MKLKLLAFAVSFALIGGSSAFAEEMAESDDLLPPDQFPGEFSANMTLATDYIFRGVSQTSQDPAIQGGIDYSIDTGFYDIGWYAGVWASNIDFDAADDGNRANAGAIEIDAYTGIAGDLMGVGWDVGFLQYWYPGSHENLEYDFWEVYGSLGYDFDILSVSGGIAYSPDFFGGTNDGIYYSAGVEVPIYKSLYASGHYGHQYIENGEDYSDMKAALGATVLGFDWEVAFTDTFGAAPDDAGTSLDDERITGSVTASF